LRVQIRIGSSIHVWRQQYIHTYIYMCVCVYACMYVYVCVSSIAHISEFFFPQKTTNLPKYNVPRGMCNPNIYSEWKKCGLTWLANVLRCSAPLCLSMLGHTRCHTDPTHSWLRCSRLRRWCSSPLSRHPGKNLHEYSIWWHGSRSSIGLTSF
jgi:hypothetical protein